MVSGKRAKLYLVRSMQATLLDLSSSKIWQQIWTYCTLYYAKNVKE